MAMPSRGLFDDGPDSLEMAFRLAGQYLEKYLNQQRLPASILNVTQVGLKFSFDESNEELPRSLSFDLSYPNSSNLKSKADGVREIAEKYLREWGLDRAAAPQNTQSAS